MDADKVDSRDIWQMRRWALFVGVNYYEDSRIPALRFCTNDATELCDFLTAKPEFGYERDRVRLVIGDNATAPATRLQVLNSLVELAEATNYEDMLLVYFAGHGIAINGEGYLIPSDAKLGLLLPDTAISLKRIKEVVQGAAARIKVIIVDACHVGIKLGSRSLEDESRDFVHSILEEAQGIGILASSTQDERSFEVADKGHGVFTYYLLEGLRGDGDTTPKDRIITLNEIANYVAQKVRDWSSSQGVSMRPNLEFQGTGDMVLLTMRGASTPAFLPSSVEHISLGPDQKNPIIGVFPHAVREPKDFYDRAEEIERISNVLNTTTDHAIIMLGERCIGKTSIINRVKRILQEKSCAEQEFLGFSIEPGSIRSCARFATELWDGLKSCLHNCGASHVVEFDASFRFDTYSGFVAQLAAVQSQVPQKTFVVFLDEFDKTIRQCRDLESNRIIGLIRYIIEATDFPMVFFMSMLSELPTSYGSPFPADKFILHPFSRLESDKMVMELLKGHVSVSSEALSRLFEYTGGRPYFIKLLLAKVFDLNDVRARPAVSMEMLEAATTTARTDLAADEVFSAMYKGDYLGDDERYVLLWIQKNQGFLTSEDIIEAGPQIRGALKKLEQRDYIVSDSGGRYHLQFGFLGDWLSSWSEYKAELQRLQVPGRTPLRTAEEEHNADLPNEVIPEGVCIDLTTQIAYVDRIPVDPEPTEKIYRALCYLIQRVGQVIPIDDFASYVWREEFYEGDDQKISALVHRLKNILGDKLERLRKRGIRLKPPAAFIHTGISQVGREESVS
jgi:hypothetical protein